MNSAPKSVQQLFQLISSYVPTNHRIPTPAHPFIPEEVPAVGEVDAMLKPPRPDGQPEHLGLRVLDEPSTQQSDPTLLAIRLRDDLRVGSDASGAGEVRAVEATPAAIDEWIASVQAARRRESGRDTLVYRHPMPDPDILTAPLAPSVQAVYQEVGLPEAPKDMSVEQLAKTMCLLNGIPTNYNMVEALHCLFALHYDLQQSVNSGAAGAGAGMQDVYNDRGIEIEGGEMLKLI